MRTREQIFNSIGTCFGVMTILALVLILAQDISEIKVIDRSSLAVGFFCLFWGLHIISRYLGKGKIIIQPSLPTPAGEYAKGIRIFSLLMGVFMLYVAVICIFVLNE